MKKEMQILVTGSSGLIGSEVVSYFDARGATVLGIDNNMRADFFGKDADTKWNLNRLRESTKNFEHFDLDIRNRNLMSEFLKEKCSLDMVVHCAAQPSHDLAADRPFDDFDVNAVGTLNLLEGIRSYSKDALFVHMSTNKVYGDAPNELPLVELDARWEYRDEADWNGVREDMRMDQSKHSIFGASKAAADLIVQEYGRYFGMRTVCLRGGCLTGPNHSGVQAHGFLSYLTKINVHGGTYTVFGYKGKQVRDNIHSWDVVRAIEEIYKNPKCGEVYNLGGGRDNSCSILEAFDLVARLSGREMNWEYCDTPRAGDHICYISDMSKFHKDYPGWRIEKSLDDTFQELVEEWNRVDRKTKY